MNKDENIDFICNNSVIYPQMVSCIFTIISHMFFYNVSINFGEASSLIKLSDTNMFGMKNFSYNHTYSKPGVFYINFESLGYNIRRPIIIQKSN